MEEYMLEAVDRSKFNTRQSEKERSEIRNRYTRVIRRLEDNQNKTACTEDFIDEIINETDSIYSCVKTTADSTIDSKILNMITEIGISKAKLVHMKVSKSSLSPQEWITQMNAFLCDTGIKQLGEIVCKYSRTAFTPDFLLGSISLERVPRQKHKSSVAETTAQGRNAQVIERLTPINDPTAQLTAMYEKLTEINEINYFLWILNPLSFAKTVENIFHTAFLIKEELALIHIDEKDEPTITLYKKEKHTKQEQKRQSVVEITMEDWKSLIEKYNVQDPILG